MRLGDLPRALEERNHAPFDVGVFSGVLYHMFDPMGGLASVRGLVRNGGILLVETSVVLDDRMTASFNANGRLFKGTHYWSLSTRTLE